MALHIRAEPSDTQPERFARSTPRPQRLRALAIGDEQDVLTRLNSLIGSNAQLAPAPFRVTPRTHAADVIFVVATAEVPWPRVRKLALAVVDVPVVVVTARGSEEDEQRALDSGATGYLALDAPPTALARAIPAALRGEIVFRRRALGRWLRPDVARPSNGSGLPHLTRRQRQIASLLATGAADKQIAAELGIGVATVQKHVSKLLRTLGATNRAAAVWLTLRGAREGR